MKTLEDLKITIEHKKMVKDGNKKLLETIVTQKIGRKEIVYPIRVPLQRQANAYKEGKELAAIFGETVLSIAKQLAPKPSKPTQKEKEEKKEAKRRGLFSRKSD